jgi:hypothetical protein
MGYTSSTPFNIPSERLKMDYSRAVSHALANTFVTAAGCGVGFSLDMISNSFDTYSAVGVMMTVIVMSHISGAYNRVVQLLV